MNNNKNIIIWILVLVILVGLGYLLFRNMGTSTTYQEPSAIVPVYPTPTTPEPSPYVPPITISTPSAQTNTSVTASTTAALVNGQVTPDGLPTTYWFEYGKTDTLGSKTPSQQVGSGFYPISTPAFITGLANNTAYYFRLAASNTMGTVYGTTYSFMTSGNPPPTISLPTVHTNNATSLASASATLNGQVNPNGWQTNYWFEYGTDNTLGSTTSIISTDNGTAIESFSQVLSGLQPATKYYFRLNTQNQFGTVNGSTLSFTTTS